MADGHACVPTCRSARTYVNFENSRKGGLKGSPQRLGEETTFVVLTEVGRSEPYQAHTTRWTCLTPAVIRRAFKPGTSVVALAQIEALKWLVRDFRNEFEVLVNVENRESRTLGCCSHE